MKLHWKCCPVSGSELAAQAVIPFGEGLSLLSLWDHNGAVQLWGIHLQLAGQVKENAWSGELGLPPP